MRNEIDISQTTNRLMCFFSIFFILCLSSMSAMAVSNNQSGSFTVTGTVIDVSGELAIGATILEQGTLNGVISGIDGKYTIKVKSPTALLLVSYIGYKDQTIAINGKKVINVTLVEDAQALEEVIVIGYGSKSKQSLTGAVGVVKNEAIEKRSTGNILVALQGAMPGVVISRGSGNINDRKNGIQIRGNSSIHDTEALIIIDGIPANMENLELLNPNDIETFTVLKDAAASIYGARAAGGVVLVTTKRGKTDKPTVQFSSRYSIAQPGILLKRTTTGQHIKMYDEANANDGRTSHEFSHLVGKEIDGSWVKGPFGDTPDFWLGDHDWSDTMFGNASTFNQDISVSGRTDRTNYMFSLGYLDENSILQHGENTQNRYTVRMNYDYEIFDGFTLGSKIAYTQMNSVAPAEMGSALSAYASSYSSMPLYNTMGEYYNFGGFSSPVAWLEKGGEATAQKNIININLSAEYEILEGLKFLGRYGMVRGMNLTSFYKGAFTTYSKDDSNSMSYPRSGKTSAGNENHMNTFHNITAHLNYDKTFKGEHTINLMAGFSQEENDYETFGAHRNNMLSDDLHTINLGDKEEQFNNGSANAWALRSYFGRVGYSAKNKYFFDATVRSDGSSKFIKEERWATFYGGSAAWLLSNESFISDLDIFDNLKFRISSGQSGNQSGIGLYDHIQLLKIEGVYPFGVDAQMIQNAKLNGMVSSTRTWETVTVNNIGVDISVLDNRLTSTFDYYIKNNDNMLVGIVYPSVLGSGAPATNSGALKTWGWELSLGWQDKIGEVSYYINGNIGDSNNELTDLAGADAYQGGWVKHREGYPINAYFGYKFDGYIQTEAELIEYKKIEGVNQSVRIGDSKFADFDGNGKLDPYGDKAKGEEGDLVYLGEKGAHYHFGIDLGLSWKGFDISATFQGVGERQIELFGEGPIYPWWNQSLEHFVGNTWTPENTDARYPRLSAVHGGVNSWNYDTASENKLVNSAYIRLKSLRVGYTLPSSWLSSIKIQRLNVYLSGNDLWETSNLPSSFDPEIGAAAHIFPFSRNYSLGLNLTF